METLVVVGDREVGFAVAHSPADVRFMESAPFPCLIWDSRGSWTNEERTEFCERLLAADCRYAVCGGVACETWHDWIDETCVDLEITKGEAAVPFIMTSGHEGEAMREVAFFLFLNTSFEEHHFKRFVVIQLGTDAAVESDLREALRLELLGLARADGGGA